MKDYIRNVESPSPIVRLKTRVDLYRKRRRRGKRDLESMERAHCVLVSPGNSGRTWLRFMLSFVLRSRYGIETDLVLDYDNFHKLDKRAPVVFFTHDRFMRYAKPPWRWHDRSEYYDRKVLLLVRHPIDTLVSQYFQWRFRSPDLNLLLKGWPMDRETRSLAEFLDHPLTGLSNLCDELGVWYREAERMRQFKLVRYEDLRSDPQTGLEDICRFMGLEVQPGIVESAVSFASFDNMRRMETGLVYAGQGPVLRPGDATNLDSYKVRRAKVGGYADHLGAAEIARFEGIVDSNLPAEYGYGARPGSAALEDA